MPARAIGGARAGIRPYASAANVQLTRPQAWTAAKWRSSSAWARLLACASVSPPPRALDRKEMDRAQTDGVQDGGQVRREEVGLARGLGREGSAGRHRDIYRAVRQHAQLAGGDVREGPVGAHHMVDPGLERRGHRVVVHGRADDRSRRIPARVSRSRNRPASRAPSAAAPGCPARGHSRHPHGRSCPAAGADDPRARMLAHEPVDDGAGQARAFRSSSLGLQSRCRMRFIAASPVPGAWRSAWRWSAGPGGNRRWASAFDRPVSSTSLAQPARRADSVSASSSRAPRLRPRLDSWVTRSSTYRKLP